MAWDGRARALVTLASASCHAQASFVLLHDAYLAFCHKPAPPLRSMTTPWTTRYWAGWVSAPCGGWKTSQCVSSGLEIEIQLCSELDLLGLLQKGLQWHQKNMCYYKKAKGVTLTCFSNWKSTFFLFLTVPPQCDWCILQKAVILPLLGNALTDAQPALGAELEAALAVLPEASIVSALSSAIHLVPPLGGRGATSYLLAITDEPSNSFSFGCH